MPPSRLPVPSSPPSTPTLGPSNASEEQRQSTRDKVAQGYKRDKKRSKLVIDPRSSKWLPKWDGIAACALIFTALVTPFEVAFLFENFATLDVTSVLLEDHLKRVKQTHRVDILVA